MDITYFELYEQLAQKNTNYTWNAQYIKDKQYEGTRGEWLTAFNNHFFATEPSKSAFSLCYFSTENGCAVVQHTMVKYKRAFQFSGIIFMSNGTAYPYHSHVPTTIQKANQRLQGSSYVRLTQEQYKHFTQYQFEIMGVINESIPF